MDRYMLFPSGMGQHPNGPYALYTDAQATIAALQAQVRELEESRDAWRASQECSEKAYMALVNQIPAERFDYDPVNVALLDGAKEQEIIGRKQIADLQAALDAEREKRTALLAEIDEGLTLSDNLLAIQTVTALYDKLTQLQALVRAFPLIIGKVLLSVGQRGEVFVEDAALRHPTYEINAQIRDLMVYRATLDATPPAAIKGCGTGIDESPGHDIPGATCL